MRPSSRFLFAVTPVVSAFLGLLTIPLMTWSLSENSIAQFGLFQYASTALLLFTTIGMDQAFLRELGSCQAHGALLRRCLTPIIILFLLTCTSILIWQKFFQKSLTSDLQQSWYFPLLLANSSLLVIFRFSSQKSRISEQGGVYLLAETALRLPLVLLLIGALISATSIPSHWAIWSIVAGTALGSLFLSISNRKLWNDLITQRTDASIPELRNLIYFGFPLALAGIMYWGFSNIGAYIVQFLHGSSDTARLIVATSLSNVAAIGQAMFSLLWLPILYGKLKSGVTPEYVSDIARRVTAGAALWFLATAIIIYIAQNLLGQKFRNIASISVALCTLPILYTISEVTFVGLLINRKSIFAMLATIVALTSNVIVNVTLTPSLGARGAAIAISISAFIFLIARTEYAGRAWIPIERRRVYFGGLSIALTGIISGWTLQPWSYISLLALCPYLWHERRLIRLLVFTNLKLLTFRKVKSLS